MLSSFPPVGALENKMNQVSEETDLAREVAVGVEAVSTTTLRHRTQILDHRRRDILDSHHRDTRRRSRIGPGCQASWREQELVL